MAGKPPLPPRTLHIPPDDKTTSHDPSNEASAQQTLLDAAVTVPQASNSLYPGGLNDPRASSTQSLGPVKSSSDERRTLLIIYIHGFLGDETSFRSFPAHVHGLLSTALAPTHVVYTKIYPRYKSRKNISFATNDFSKWLAVHESDTTDVILAGHSLGGILAAEVILLPPEAVQSNELFRHRILGLLAFDVPYFGMHPGVVGTGIASLFRTPAELVEAASPDFGPFSEPSPVTSDPTYNPSYDNDMRLASRKGKLERAWYFFNKHAGALSKAASDYVSSHLEFGGCLADYIGLRRRYSAIRALEDVNELMRPKAANGRLNKRVRFVNYYTVSTGPAKREATSPAKAPDLLELPEEASAQQAFSHDRSGNSTPNSLSLTSTASPRLSLEEYRDDEIITKDEVIAKDLENLSIDPQGSSISTVSLPQQPAEAMLTAQEQSSLQDEEDVKLVSSNSNEIREDHDGQKEKGEEKPAKKPKDRTFCMLPSKNSLTGQRDSSWIKVHMTGIDEVQAHTSMFIMGETYIALVQDTVNRVEQWVQEDATRRMILAEMDAETWE
ncbi:hypothetical protein PV11_06209 [Exophiala sideris]|uniref:DUF676 domain-containing protein n=1 Tax=Exophiala sideris TaxID=1016849 RepID=A0A0D1VRB1_9EURO|nr:hypothetical protein PV11_06209 [Exophiala sideris]